MASAFGERFGVGAALTNLTSFAVLTGCASSDTAFSGHATSMMSAPAPRQAGHNQADVTFAQGMIPHHEQAITMANSSTATLETRR